jgi:hypothetical protein
MVIATSSSSLILFRESPADASEWSSPARPADDRSSQYFRDREAAERRAADGAGSAAARRAHERLAEQYAVLAEGSLRA